MNSNISESLWALQIHRDVFEELFNRSLELDVQEYLEKDKELYQVLKEKYNFLFSFPGLHYAGNHIVKGEMFLSKDVTVPFDEEFYKAIQLCSTSLNLKILQYNNLSTSVRNEFKSDIEIYRNVIYFGKKQYLDFLNGNLNTKENLLSELTMMVIDNEKNQRAGYWMCTCF